MIEIVYKYESSLTPFWGDKKKMHHYFSVILHCLHLVLKMGNGKTWISISIKKQFPRGRKIIVKYTYTLLCNLSYVSLFHHFHTAYFKFLFLYCLIIFVILGIIYSGQCGYWRDLLKPFWYRGFRIGHTLWNPDMSKYDQFCREIIAGVKSILFCLKGRAIVSILAWVKCINLGLVAEGIKNLPGCCGNPDWSDLIVNINLIINFIVLLCC